MCSGIVLNSDVVWITFHGGMDFGYLMSMLLDQELPQDEHVFLKETSTYFPNKYDLKYMKKNILSNGGLNKLADQLGIRRIGTMHQAGSDSLVTLQCYFKLITEWMQTTNI